MEFLNLTYVNGDFSSFYDFEVEISFSYQEALKRFGPTAYIPLLLKEAKGAIEEFGAGVDFPAGLVNFCSDEELDYMMMLIEKDVDAFIEGHVFVKIPSEHAINLIEKNDSSKVWRANGVGLSRMLLVCQSEGGISVTLPTFMEAKNGFTTYEETAGASAQASS